MGPVELKWHRSTRGSLTCDYAGRRFRLRLFERGEGRPQWGLYEETLITPRSVGYTGRWMGRVHDPRKALRIIQLREDQLKRRARRIQRAWLIQAGRELRDRRHSP